MDNPKKGKNKKKSNQSGSTSGEKAKAEEQLEKQVAGLSIQEKKETQQKPAGQPAGSSGPPQQAGASKAPKEETEDSQTKSTKKNNKQAKKKGQPSGDPQPQQPPTPTAWGPRQPTPPQQQQPPPAAWPIRQPAPPQQQQPPPAAWPIRQPAPPQQQQPPPAWGPRQPAPPQQQQQAPPPAWGPRQPAPPQQQQQAPPPAWGPRQPAPPQQQQQAPAPAWGPRQPAPPQQQQQAPPPAWGPRQQQQSEAGGDTQKTKPGQPKKGGQKGGDKAKAGPHGDSSQKPSGPPGPGPKPEVSLIPFAKRIYGDSGGRRITVQANYFPLKIANPNIVVYHYDVEIVPDTPKFLLREAWNKFSKEQFGGRVTVFDGRKNAFSKGKLMDKPTHSGTVKVFNSHSGREREFNMTLTEVRKVDFSVFANFKEKLKTNVKLPEAEIAVLEIILKNGPCNQLVASGRSFFPMSKMRPTTYNLSDSLVLRIGHYQSATLGSQPYLNFDIAQKAFYRSADLITLTKSFVDRSGNLDEDAFDHFLRSANIRYQLPNQPETMRIYRVNKLVGSAAKTTFKKDDSSAPMSVAEYFAREKKCTLRYPNLPLVWAGPTQKTIYLPMEFCTVVDDQVYKGEMTPNETREMVRNATSNARQRKQDTMHAFQCVDYNNVYMKEFGISVDNKMAAVSARVLDPPTLKTSRPVSVRDGVWRTRDFLDPKSLDKWCILNLDKYARKENLENFKNLVVQKGKEFNMRISPPCRSTIEGSYRPQDLQRTLHDLRDLQLVFVVIPDFKGVYASVKNICETQEGILTQCVKARTVGQDYRKIGTTIENILLKVNAKLGGRNHSLEPRALPSCLGGYVMVVGADVTHSGPGSKIPSVAAVAVSCDATSFQYGISTRVQVGEVIQDLKRIMDFHVENFKKLRGQYPEKIIFYRDGVSEGELPIVFSTELKAVKAACAHVKGCKITFIIVQKRHHTRLYPTSERDEIGKNFNVPVGTCVDSEIVHPRDLDFYLVSHASILGTARPTRYRLLYDDNCFTDDEIEKLSFYLCHLYARCNRSVSYPSPTYNAHLAAFRVRSYLEARNLTKNQKLEDIQAVLKDKISATYPMFFV